MRIAVVLFAIADGALATDYTWNGAGADSNWDTPLNWINNSGFPNAATDRAIFSGTNRTILALDGDKTIGELIFTNTTVGWTISGNTLTIPAGGRIVNYVNDWPNGVTWTVSSALNLLGDAYFSFLKTDGNARKLNLSGQITGNGTIYLAGIGGSGITISGNNTGFVGTVICTTGVVDMANANAFGTNSTPVEIRAGVSIQQPSGSKPLRAIGNFTMSWGFTYNGPIELASNATFRFSTGGGNPCTINGAISGTGNVTAELNARFAGTSANTYTGLTTVIGQSLYLNKTAGNDAVPGALLVGDGTSSGRAELLNSNQINDASIVTLWNSSSVYGGLRLNGFSETIGGLATTGGLAGTAYVENTHTSNVSTLTIANLSNCTFGGVIQNGGTAGLNIIKTNNGELFINGMATNTGTFAVNGGALGGTGLIWGAVTVAGGVAISPGSAVGAGGTMTISNDLTFASNAVLNVSLSAPLIRNSSATNSMISGVKNLALPRRINVSALPGFMDARPGDYWTLISYSGTMSGSRPVLGSFPQVGRQFLVVTDTPGEIRLVLQRTATIMTIR